MQNRRRLSRLIAEELESRGYDASSSSFDDKVSDIVDMVDEAVKEPDPKDAGNDIFESVLDGDLFYANEDTTISGVEVRDGDFVEIVDAGDEPVITVYDNEGYPKEGEENVSVDADELEDFVKSADFISDEDVDDDDEEEIDEKHISFKGGKKHVVSDKIMRLKKKYKGTNKYVGADGKVHTKSAAQKKAQRMAGKRMKRVSKLAHRGKAARLAAKARKLNAGAEAGTAKVTEGFDAKFDGTKVALNEGDILTYEDGLLSIERNGESLMENISIDESFIDKCYDAGVLESVDEGWSQFEVDVVDKDTFKMELNGKTYTYKCDDSDAKGWVEKIKYVTKAQNRGYAMAFVKKLVKAGELKSLSSYSSKKLGGTLSNASEGKVLTYNADKGYTLVKEGSELPMGNRLRTRSVLKSMEGIDVTTEQLDKAFDGEVVVLD